MKLDFKTMLMITQSDRPAICGTIFGAVSLPLLERSSNLHGIAKQAGYFIPLSGGIDSCATSVIVYSMCRLVFEAIEKGENPIVLADLRRISGEEDDSTWSPSSPQDIAGRIFHTAFMGMEQNSSPDTRKRARDLSAAIGGYHLNFDIDTVVSAVTTLFSAVTNFTPRYKMYRRPMQQYLQLLTDGIIGMAVPMFQTSHCKISKPVFGKQFSMMPCCSYMGKLTSNLRMVMAYSM